MDYVIDSNVTRDGNVTVTGNVNLILVNGFTLSVTGSPDNAGITVSPGYSLNVYGRVGNTSIRSLNSSEHPKTYRGYAKPHTKFSCIIERK